MDTEHIDEDLQSRQLAVYGRESMRKLRDAHILIVGMNGLGAEIAKNVILANVKAVTLCDTTPVQLSHLSSHFYLVEKDVGRPIAEACSRRFQELNPYAAVSTISEVPSSVEAYSCVVAIDVPLNIACQLNDACRARKPAASFIRCAAHGLFGTIFTDFGSEFVVHDVTGEEAKTAIVSSISQAKPGLVTCVEDNRLDFEDGEIVRFTEVEGMTELNTPGRTFKVSNVKAHSFELEDTTGLSPYKTGGIVTQVVAIMILNKIYERVANRLTEWELHRTQSKHEDSFVFKMFLFQFCNYYGSIFYIAFFKGRFTGSPSNQEKLLGFRTDECAAGGCLVELSTQLAIIMVGKQALNNFLEIILPKIKLYLANRNQTEVNTPDSGDLTRWEEDFALLPKSEFGMFYEYLEMVLQYGFLTLFVTAFPLAPLFAFVNNIIEIRVDANKYLVQTRRPFAARAEDIGIWQGIMMSLSYLAVITNGLVISLTSNFVPRMVYKLSVKDKFDMYGHWHGSEQTLEGFVLYTINRANITKLEAVSSTFRDLANRFYWHSMAGRLAFLITFEHIVFFIKAVIAFLVPDIPGHIRKKRQREAFLSRTMLHNHDMDMANI